MTVKTMALLTMFSVCNALPRYRFSPRGDSFPSIPLQWKSPFDPWSARLSFGTPPQEVPVAMEMDDPYLFLGLDPGTYYVYIPEQSSTARPTSQFCELQYGRPNGTNPPEYNTYSGNIVYDTVSAGGLNLLGQQICVTNFSGLQPAFTAETNVKRSLSKRSDIIYGVCGIGPDFSVRERGMNRTGSFLDHFASIYNSSRSYSINMGPSSSDPNGPAGEILLGAVDPTKFSGPLVPDTLYEPETLGYYSLAAPELTLLLPGEEIPLPFGEQKYCLFDSGSTASRVPSSVTALIATALSGTNPTDNVITADCSLLTNVTLRHTFKSYLTGQPLTIDQPLAEYLQNWGDAPATEGQCQLPIEQSSSDCLLGQFFLSRCILW